MMVIMMIQFVQRGTSQLKQGAVKPRIRKAQKNVGSFSPIQSLRTNWQCASVESPLVHFLASGPV